jgi:hypothetical protein
MHRLRSVILFVLLAALAEAQTRPASSPQERPPLSSRIRGLFDFDLPAIDPPGTVKLIVHPHFGDLIRRDYMRVDGGFRWALNKHFEITPEAAVYFTHGLGDGGDGYGVGELRMNTKYVIPAWPKSNMETALTLNLERPVGHAPIDMTDGLNHIAPAFTVQHRLRGHWKWTTFGGAGLDLVSRSDVLGTPVRNQPVDDSMNFTAGAIYDLGQIRYTLSATYATTAVLGDKTDHFFYLRPNVLWYVPKKYTFNSKTQWILAVGARASWGPDGSEVSFSNRVRAEITFRQVMDKIRNRKPGEGGGR